MAEEYISKKVDSIEFGFLSPEHIKKMATAKVVTPELYDKEGYPVDGGLMDIRLGVIDPGLRCKSCGGKLKECIGHFGYIELARSVVHLKGINIILAFLRSTCRDCGRILVSEEEIEKLSAKLDNIEAEKGVTARRKQVNLLINKLKNVKKCPHCQAKQFKVSLEKPTTIIENDKRIFPIEMRSKLEKINDTDVRLLGLEPRKARPEWVVLTLLPIPPVTIRPSITLESGERSEDDLTHKLGDIVRINQRLFENINAGAPEIIVEDLWDLLQYHITTFFDNSTVAVPPARHRSGEPLKTITERIKSKEGRFRHNLTGKRVNYSARTLISPDPMIALNEVGVPLEVAMELTIPERVTEWNIERLKEFIKRGSKIYPGANYVIRSDGKKKKITEETKEQLLEELQPGFVVERHLMDNDVSIFNRQPSLHRMSIMGHRVKILPGRSFRLNPSVCVAPDTNVQLSSGIQRPIDELKNCWKESELATFDWKKKSLKSTELKKFWGLKPEEYGAKCYKIKTNTGREVVATGDHPFYIKNGLKQTKKLKLGDRLILRPLDTPIFKEIEKELITDKAIENVAPKETYIKHAKKTLRDLKLLPLNLKDQRVMIVGRLMGHLFGDGTFILKKDSARLIFRGKKKDLITIRKDIESLGFKPEKIYIKTVENKIITVKGKKLNIKGSGYDFEIRSKPLALLFSALGTPNGDKAKLGYRVPKWIIDGPDFIKREFLASYFGSELTKVKIRESSSTSLRSLVFKISKIESKFESAKLFVSDISNLLKIFNVKIGSVRIEEGNLRKDGNITKVLVISIHDNKSIRNLLGKIGYIYDSEKDNIARLAYQYLIEKQKQIEKREKDCREILDLFKKYKSIKKIMEIKSDYSRSQIEFWVYNKKDFTSGLQNNFISFDEWKLKNADIKNGFVYDPIEEIKETYVPFVYDVTTTENTHNFFANGFLSSNCTPYNADFDGDEMNLHIPQTEEAKAEVEILMEVQTQIITPKNGLNIVACIQDAITGNYVLTKTEQIPREEAVGLLISIGIEDVSKLPNTKNVSGKDVFSVLLPNDFDFVSYDPKCTKCIKGNKEKCEDDLCIHIKNGKLLSGVIDKEYIGEGGGHILRTLYTQYSPERAVKILGEISKLGIRYLLVKGFSTGLVDTDLSENVLKQINEIIEDAEKRVDSLIQEYEAGKLEAYPSKTKKETLELKILEVLNKTRNKAGEVVVKNNTEDNPTMIMANSGARGNPIHLAQITALVGQQALRGERINKGYKNRTLSHFKKNDLKASPHGFIRNGYKHGLNPSEFFFHAMTGRDSLMDTALRTPKSGYLYRRLANALQDLKVEYDGTVRTSDNSIVQFRYGDDGIDISRSEGGTINVKRIVRNIVKNA
ncbi:MAG: hypothetical protein KKG75_01020 [Nanoarchaeota archaeon]|nr:hypothetical protein [Nanoarchaeota archaeon]